MSSDPTEEKAAGRLLELKRLFEDRRWAELEAALGSPEVWLLDSFVPVREALGRAKREFDHCVNLDVTLERILHSEAAAADVRASYRCSLSWKDPQRGERRCGFDLHLGLEGPGLRIAYAGVTSFTPAPGADRGNSIPFLPAAAAGEAIPDGHVLVYMPVWIPASVARSWLGAGPETDS